MTIPVGLSTKIAAIIPNARKSDPVRSTVNIVPIAFCVVPVGSASAVGASSAEMGAASATNGTA